MKKTINVIIFIVILSSFASAYCSSCSASSINSSIAEITSQIEEYMQQAAEIEKRIKNRNFFMRMFLGGDWQAGRELEEIVDQNNERIEQLKQIMEQCENCSEEVLKDAKSRIKEHKRLKAVAVIEQGTRGLFGWFKR